MANETDGEGEKIDDFTEGILLFVWLAVGVAVGLALASKYVASLGFGPEDILPTDKGIFMSVLFLGPPILFFVIGDNLHKEVQKGKTAWSTYSVTLSTLAVAAFTFAGISDIDDLLRLLRDV